MFMRRLLTALCVLLFSLQATCAAIQTVSGRSVDITNNIETPQPSQLPPTPNVRASDSLRRSDQSGADDQIHERHGTIDWRQDPVLKFEAEREAGFHASSQPDDEYPSPDFWPLFKICVVSAIAICLLKILRDVYQ